MVVAVVGGGLYAVGVHEAACQSRYNQALAVQVTERSRIGSASDKAQSDLLLGVSKLISAKPSTDPKVRAKRTKEFLKLFSEFDKATKAVELARQQSPLPPIPKC